MCVTRTCTGPLSRTDMDIHEGLALCFLFPISSRLPSLISPGQLFATATATGLLLRA